MNTEENTQENNQDLRIPVTILTGYLGSGKTTLLNAFLNGRGDQKYAVIENEIGDISIDQELVVKLDEGLFEISSGCICCTLNAELGEQLHRIRQNIHPDHLLIETTGIADPAGVAEPFMTDFSLVSAYRLNAVIAVVHPLFLESQIHDHPEVLKQLSFASHIVIGRTDQVDESKIREVQELISRLCPGAQILLSQNGRCDFELNEYRTFGVVAQDFNKIEGTNHFKSKWKLRSKNAQDHHDQEVSTWSFVFDEEINLMEFNFWMNSVLKMQSENIFRTKGILNIDRAPKKMVFQSVRNEYLWQFSEDWESSEKRQSKLVFIGKNLNPEILEKRIRHCFVKK
jgi:G3E family GTPase